VHLIVGFGERNVTEPLLTSFSGFRREVAENCALLGCYAPYTLSVKLSDFTV